MDNLRNWLLPLLLAAGQAVLLWPGTELTGGTVPGGWPLVGVLTATAVDTVALGRWRRRRPVLAWAGTLGASVLGPLSAWEQYAGYGLMVALFSVAVRCRGVVVLWATAASIACDGAIAAVREGPGSGLLNGLTIITLLYTVCVGTGQARRQWTVGRWSAARRLARAQDGGRLAADSERHRLGRELHDVGAHHLTSVVVTVEAARRLGDQRPELVTEALSFAGRTGRETLTALRRLVAVMRDTDPPEARPMTGRIEELVAAFGRLGRPVTLDLPADLAGPAAEAVFGIAREALTNALRYAPGAVVDVRVLRVAGALELTVDNGPSRAAGPHDSGGLGSGRGIAGMRERATALGGELTAGTAGSGGWRVRAVLPDTAGPRERMPTRRHLLPRGQWLINSSLVALGTLLPLPLVLSAAETGSGKLRIAELAVLLALFAVHALPLLWRRRAPWAVLVATAATAGLWPLARAAGAVSSAAAPYLVFGGVAEAMAVYALAAYGAGARRTWTAAVTVGLCFATAVTLTAAADGALQGGGVSSADVLWTLVPLALLSCVFLASAWAAGITVRARRLRVLAREDTALTDSVRRAAAAAEAERRRVAAGLREAVLDHTARLVDGAEQGQLAAVAVQARAALDAMRELLHQLSAEGLNAPGRAPQPSLADLEGLCAKARAGGRKVVLRGLPERAGDLPAAVALAAYRVVEAALGAGDSGTARVVLDRRRDGLHLVVSGVRLAVAGPVAQRLGVQAEVAGGRISFDRPGTVRVWLPALHPAVPAEEGFPSPYA